MKLSEIPSASSGTDGAPDITVVLCTSAQDGMRWQRDNPRRGRTIRAWSSEMLPTVKPLMRVEVVRTPMYACDPSPTMDEWTQALASANQRDGVIFIRISGVLYAVNEVHLHITTDRSELESAVKVHDDLRRWGELRIGDEQVAFIATNASVSLSPIPRLSTVELIEPIVWLVRPEETVAIGEVPE